MLGTEGSPMSKSQRVNRGFQRLGLVLGAIVLLIGGSFAWNDYHQVSEIAVNTLVTALAVYAFFRAIGWIIGGFMSS